MFQIKTKQTTTKNTHTQKQIKTKDKQKNTGLKTLFCSFFVLEHLQSNYTLVKKL